MNSRLFFLVTVFLFRMHANAQEVPVIHIGDLEKRISNAGDTTLIVNFWATWCAPCVKELPDLDSIARSYDGKMVKVLLVTLDFKEDISSKVAPFVKKKKLFPEVMLLDELNGNYFIPKVDSSWTGAIPSTLIINNKKKYRKFFEKKISYSLLAEQIDIINNKP